MRLAAAAIGAALTCGPVLAAPPPGTIMTGQEHLWWECQYNVQMQRSCCGDPGKDGHVLTAWVEDTSPQENDWRVVPVKSDATDPGDPSGYEVFIGGGWWSVQRRYVTNSTAKCGLEPNMDHRFMAKAWWSVYQGHDGSVYGVNFLCFEGAATF